MKSCAELKAVILVIVYFFILIVVCFNDMGRIPFVKRKFKPV